MLKLHTNGAFGVNVTSYASAQNSRFNNSASNIRTVSQRWHETINALPANIQSIVFTNLKNAKAEFLRRNPNAKKWEDLALAEAKTVQMSMIAIDGTMQRQLNVFWVLELLNKFLATMVVPIQVYRPKAEVDEFLAWDGQHTLVLLWLIATEILNIDPVNAEIPVNIYQSALKAQMRANFVSLNSKEGKKQLDLIDIFEQQVFGVRVDHSTNPIWQETEEKQQAIEHYGLFVTAKKFGNDDMPGAISRLQEINKLNPQSVADLCFYLSLSTNLTRQVEEKEMVMMAHYFDRCRHNNIKVNDQYIIDLADVATLLWNADFSPDGKFWTQVCNAYHSWHFINSNNLHTPPRCNKEPVHGFPFLVAQLTKSFPHPVPRSDSKSEFWPDSKDLF